MLNETAATIDGVALARTVRAVAGQARRTLNRPANPTDTRELLRAVDSLERDLLDRPSGDLARWARNLRRRVETHGIVPA